MFTFKSSKILAAIQSPSLNIPIRRCSVPIKLYPSFLASINADSTTLLVLGVKSTIFSIGSSLPINSSILFRISSAVTFWFSNTFDAIPLPSLASPYNMCSVPM